MVVVTFTETGYFRVEQVGGRMGNESSFQTSEWEVPVGCHRRCYWEVVGCVSFEFHLRLSGI